MKLRYIFYNVEQAQKPRYTLRNHRGIGGARRSHVEYYDKYQIQHNVQERGKNQKIQRSFAVPDCS